MIINQCLAGGEETPHCNQWQIHQQLHIHSDHFLDQIFQEK